MFTAQCQHSEAQWHRRVNRVIEPLTRTGFGSPTTWCPGIIIVETIGRKTGRTFTIPLLATQIGESLLISTIRRKSQWIKNLAAHPEVRYWKDNREHSAITFVLTPQEAKRQSSQISPKFAWLIRTVRPYSSIYGGGAALLMPQHSQHEDRSSS